MDSVNFNCRYICIVKYAHETVTNAYWEENICIIFVDYDSVDWYLMHYKIYNINFVDSVFLYSNFVFVIGKYANNFQFFMIYVCIIAVRQFKCRIYEENETFVILYIIIVYIFTTPLLVHRSLLYCCVIEYLTYTCSYVILLN